MRDGWEIRLRTARVLYSVGAVLLLGSLPLPLYGTGEIEGVVDKRCMWEVLTAILGTVFTGNVFRGDARFFYVHTLPPIGLAWSYLLVLPGCYLLWLSGRSRMGRLVGRLLWLLTFLVGPGLVIGYWLAGEVYGEVLRNSGWGFRLWLAGVALLSLSSLVVPLAGAARATPEAVGSS